MRSLWKNKFFAHVPENFNIRGKGLFSDHFQEIDFCPYFRKHYLFAHFNTFVSYVQKDKHFERKKIILRSLCLKMFFPIYPKISFFRRKVRYFEIAWEKNRFLSIYPKISTFCSYFQKFQHILLRSLWKNKFFANVTENFNIRGKLLFFDHFQEIDFCPFFINILTFEARTCF